MANVPPLDSPNFDESEEGPKGSPYRMLLLRVGAIAGLIVAGYFVYQAKYGGRSNVAKAEYLLHTVKRDNLDLTVVERGTLESADNKDLICKVKAGSKGNYASTIKWVIDDGTIVTKGQPVMTLDSSQLEDQYRSQKIALDKAHAEMVTADQQYRITISENESKIEKARTDIQLMELDLEKYVGLPRNALSKRKREEARQLLTEMESNLESFLAKHKNDFPDVDGQYQADLDDLSGKIELAIADLEMWKDRVGYSQRAQLKGFLPPAQVQADEARLNAAREALKKVQTDKLLLQKFVSSKTVKETSGKVQESWRTFDREKIQAEANEVKAEAERRTKRSIFLQEEEKLKDIEDQLAQCQIHAPQDGMVVYYIPETSRWSTSERGLIQQGASVQEGQKMMRIPDLKKMQVTTRVHEAMVSRIRGDDRRSTGIHESFRASLLLNLSPMNAILSHLDPVLEGHRATYRDREYYSASAGQNATIRIDAFPDKVLKAHVRTVATVASSSDFMSSDVKVYTTIVTIDDQVDGLKPGMSAEVTIHVDNTLENIVVIPVQAVVGGAESGKTRTVYVMTADGAVEREVQIGLSNEKMAEIRSGLEEGDQIVLNPKVIVGDKAKTREEASEKGAKGKGGFGKMGGGKGGPPGGPPGGGGGGPGK
jgi:HlyD family secretion protein